MYKTARIKLTAWYLLIIVMVSLSFSTIIYRSYSDEVERFERTQRLRFAIRFERPTDLLEDSKHRVLMTLIYINGLIFVTSAGLGYFLAGRTLKPIEEMVEEQNRFIADASHELKTPLTSLKTAFEVYLRDKNGTLPDAKMIITESITEVNKLQFLSESLLKLARLKKPISNFIPIPFNTIIQEVVKKLTPLAKEKNLKIITHVGKMEINGDKNNLAELVTILLDNAIKYSPKGKEVIINLQNNVLTIKDQGMGIDQKDMPHIFERFYRAQKSRTNNGFGLGLAIAKDIVRAHNGEITAESQDGIGTIFTVTFHA